MSIPENPNTRIERYLDVIAGGNAVIPDEPHTRIERYLDVLAGGNGTKPADPHTRIERYLDAIVDGTYKREESSEPYNTLVIPDNSSDELILKSLVGASVVWNQLSPSGGGTVTIPANRVYYFRQTRYIAKTVDTAEIVCDSESVLVDLTTMFGATVAEYIYNNEMVSWFETFIENLDTSYTAGEFVSVRASAHVIKDVGGVVQHTYPLDPSLELRGVVKLDADEKLYYDGDVYESRGNVNRKYGIVDLGTLTWQYRSAQGVFSLGSGRGFSKTRGNVICAIYPQYTGGIGNMPDMTVATFSAFNANDIVIKNSNYTTASSFKSAMSGVYLVYELATPTTETATPFTNLQTVVPGGTASFVGNDIPVGADVILSVKAV